MMRRFELKQYIEAIEKFGITELAMVPTMMIALLNSPLATRHALKSIRCIWIGGSPVRSSTQAEFQALLSPEARIAQVWGMTESGWATTLFWPHTDNSGSVGRTFPGTEMKSVVTFSFTKPNAKFPISRLVTEGGSVVEEDCEQGEIYVKGPCMMLGYLGNPEATAAAIDSDGWLKSGDVGYRSHGLWYIIDRKKELLKVRGWQVAPAELEAILLSHPQIFGAAVIGVPLSDGTGEVPRAYVVRKPTMEAEAAASYGLIGEKPVGEEEVKAYLAARLAKYKALAGGVQFVDEIPRNASGKALKFKLREMMNEIKHGGAPTGSGPLSRT